MFPQHSLSVSVMRFVLTCLLVTGLFSATKAQPKPDSNARVKEAIQNYLKARELSELAQFDEAIALNEKSLAVLEKELGKEHVMIFPVLNNLAETYREKGDYVRAEQLFLRALEIGEKTLGPDNFLVANVVNNLGILYQEKNEYARAEVLLKRSLAIGEKVFGPESAEFAVGLNNLAKLYRDRRAEGDLANAESLYLQALDIKKKKLSSDDPSLATAYANLAMLYHEKGELTRAESLFLQALAIREKITGPNHPTVALLLSNLASLYSEKGDYSKAELLWKRALTIQEKVFGANHVAVAQVLNGLAVLYKEKREYARAEPLYKRALAIHEQTFGPEDPSLAALLNNLAILYKEMGNFSQARTLHLRALSLQEKLPVPESLELANTMGALAELYREMGNYNEAEPLYRRALAIEERLSSPQHPDTAELLNNLGFLQFQKGDYVDAELLFLRALAIREKVLGAEHPEVAQTLGNLALLSINKGDYARSDVLQERALAIREKMFVPDHPEIAISLNNLAHSYHQRGETSRAEPLYRRALEIWQKAYGSEHSMVAAALHNLGEIYAGGGDFTRADSTLHQALAIKEKVFGPEHPDVALTVRGIGGLYLQMREYAKAEQMYKRALAIFEKAFGSYHTSVSILLADLSELSFVKGEYGQAVEFMTRTNEIRERNLASILSIGSEQEKQTYLNTITHETYISIWLHLLAPNDPAAVDLAITTVLRRKGRVLDAVADQITNLRSHATKEDLALFDALRNARSQFATLQMTTQGQWSAETKRREIQKAAAKVEGLEFELGRRNAEFRAQTQPITLEGVRQALPKDAALVEIFVYLIGNRKNSDSEAKKQVVPGYIAYVVRGDGAPVQWVDLGPITAIDAAIETWRTALQDPQRKDVQKLSRSVDEVVMRPVRKLLGNTRHIFISPDGLLNLIPFAALTDENGKYLVENYSIDYLTSGRDLLRLQVEQDSRSAPVIVANPIYDLSGITQRTTLGQDRIDKDKTPTRRSLDFTLQTYAPLSGTAEEAKALARLLPEGTMTLLQEQATEANLKQVNGPLVLHIATHGFFLPDQPAVESLSKSSLPGSPDALNIARQQVLRENPLLRSGLILAGVKQGQRGAGEDGVLTALEVAGLDLRGTKLVVLSACQTGLGEVKNGSGVYGLRRALILAGSQTQVISLWKVSDAGTRDLMTAYYTRLQNGEQRGEALRKVQLMMLTGQLEPTGSSGKRETTDTTGRIVSKDYRHPFYWAAFIQSGDWRSLR